MASGKWLAKGASLQATICHASALCKIFHLVSSDVTPRYLGKSAIFHHPGWSQNPSDHGQHRTVSPCYTCDALGRGNPTYAKSQTGFVGRSVCHPKGSIMYWKPHTTHNSVGRSGFPGDIWVTRASPPNGLTRKYKG